MSNASPFKFPLNSTVRISGREEGEVIGSAIYTYAEPGYLVRYVAGDGRMVESWRTEGALAAVEPIQAAA